MKKLSLSLLLVSVVSITGLSAADRLEHFSIKEALADSRSNGNIDPEIKLQFGDKHHKGRLWTAIKRTFAGNKTDQEACNRAFNSAIIALQERARREGKNSVVDIYSFHRKKKYDSKDKYECAVGSLMVAVTLQGRVK